MPVTQNIDPRPQGVYASQSLWPPGGGELSELVTTVEKVEGDGSVRSIMLAPDEYMTLLRWMETNVPKQQL